MSKKKKKLKNLSVVEVSLVGRPANGKTFLLAKGEQKMQLSETLQNIVSTAFDTEEKFLEALKKEEIELTDEAKSALMSAMRMLAAYSEELPSDLMGIIRQSLGMEDETKADEVESEKSAETEPTEKQERLEAETQDDVDEVTKAIENLPEDIKSTVENLWKEKQEAIEKMEQVEKELEQEKQEKIRKDFVTKAEKEFSKVPSVNAEELGSLLKQLHDVDEDLCNKFSEIFKATDAAMNAGGLFDEIGKKTVTDDGANAYDKMRASATALVANGQATTIEKAMDVVMKSNPKLYQDYLAGN